ncbi:hypothetical protein C8F04DRAFT_1024544 [Mycena alexandri]|uniref:DUF6699 domain-containing protein n=1 Tax=Mycena alexandri TaxID=1745969 RepID=A0AAD6TIX5_9AGAR|nr:hypothetical protein C8F04DRAFT_1024544 [Mycena alexandri]
MDPQENLWRAYAPPRDIITLSSPWIPPPDSAGLDAPFSGRVHKIYPATQAVYASKTSFPVRNLRRILRGLRRFISREDERVEYAEDHAVYHPSKAAEVEKSTPSEWHAFGIYSRPIVNKVEVHNTFTPSPTPYRVVNLDQVDPEDVFQSLLSPGGNVHPELWIRGLEHPSLPPRPTGWPLPPPGEPLPFPWECELNPFLIRTDCGPAPVYWNIRSSELAILYGGPIDVSVPLSGADLSQPATRPFVTHMYISGLALAESGFPWKFMVVNPAGIRVRDVFRAIMDNFQQYVSRAEYESWTPARQQRAKLEWGMRGGDRTRDGLRRVDYLCGQLCFRGLSWNLDRTGWVLHAGPEW